MKITWQIADISIVKQRSKDKNSIWEENSLHYFTLLQKCANKSLLSIYHKEGQNAIVLPSG